MLDPGVRLRQAVIEGNLTNVKRLLLRFPELWLNVDLANNGWTNLHYALYHGHYLVCFYLVRHANYTQHSQVDLLLFDNLTALHLLTINHHHQVLTYLLQEFGDSAWLEVVGDEWRRTALHYCCIYGFARGVRLLLEFGADYSARDANGDSVLHLCFQYQNMECVDVLLHYISRTANDSVATIRYLELVRNHRGLLAQEYLPTFELEQEYEKIKLFALKLRPDDASLAPLILSGAAPPAVVPELPAVTSPRVMDLPIVSVAKQKNTTRAHSLSLPGMVDRPNIPRKRSQTTNLTTKPGTAPSPISNPLAGALRTSLILGLLLVSGSILTTTLNDTNSSLTTFVKPHAPSIKLVTISPSIRKNSLDATFTPIDPASPQLTMSELPEKVLPPRKLRLATTIRRNDSFGFLASLNALQERFTEPATSVAQAAGQAALPTRRRPLGTPLSLVRIKNSSRASLKLEPPAPPPQRTQLRHKLLSLESLRLAFGLRKTKSLGHINGKPTVKPFTAATTPALPQHEDGTSVKGISFNRVR